jgi:hypothetical protein
MYFDYPFVIFRALCCLFFFNLCILITPLLSLGHCVVCSSLIYVFWLPPFVIFKLFLLQIWHETSDGELKLATVLCLDVESKEKGHSFARLMKCHGSKGSQAWVWTKQVLLQYVITKPGSGLKRYYYNML